VVLWVPRWNAIGCIDAKWWHCSAAGRPGEFLLGLIAKQPDLTLDEVVAAMAKALGSLVVAPR